ncbi:hypothetical protein [Candidatus Chlorohelix allophototropha]
MVAYIPAEVDYSSVVAVLQNRVLLVACHLHGWVGLNYSSSGLLH